MKNNQLFNGALLFFLLIIGALIFSAVTHKVKGYKTGNRDLLQQVVETEFVMNYGAFDALYNDSSASFTIVDLRPVNKFTEPTLRNAVNIPFDSIVIDSYVDKIKEIEGPKYLIAAEQTQAALAYLIWRSVGVNDISVIPGSFDVLWQHIILDKNTAYYYYNEEKARWDFPRQMGGQAATKTTATPVLPQQTTVKTAVKGGC